MTRLRRPIVVISLAVVALLVVAWWATLSVGGDARHGLDGAPASDSTVDRPALDTVAAAVPPPPPPLPPDVAPDSGHVGEPPATDTAAAPAPARPAVRPPRPRRGREPAAAADPHPPSTASWADALRGLDSSQVRLEAPAQMTARRLATVWLRIARRAALPSPARDRDAVATADTVLLVGDSARACLTVPPSWAFAESTPACRSQLVAPGTDNAWRWEVAPDEAADAVPVSASLTAIIPEFGQKEFYSGTVTVHVAVAPCPLYRADCLLAAASTWQGILAAFGAIAATVTGALAWLRRRREPAPISPPLAPRG